MAKRGRPSAASLEIVQNRVDIVERQIAPHDLTDEETEIWVSVVNCHPADWFTPSNTPLLSQYCRHVIHARRVAELLEKATGDKDMTLDDYDRLLKMQERESRTIASLASRMSITQQATTNFRGNKKPASRISKPWDG